MDSERIILDFLRLESVKEIASKYRLHPDDVRLLLANALPEGAYIRIAHATGARKVTVKLENPSFRKSYVEKMKASVHSSLLNKMTDSGFRENWLIKAKKASVKGNEKIKMLLNDPDFFSSWSKKCSVGGQILRRSNQGIFDPRLRDMRKIWSLRGLQRTGKKYLGPCNEKMYNRLESQTATAILSAGFSYHYEAHLPAENLNGFFSVDFLVEEIPLLIEVTYWDKIEDKCRELERKFSYFKTMFPDYFFIVITKPSMRDNYKRMLPDNIIVLTVSQLESLMAGFHFSK